MNKRTQEEGYLPMVKPIRMICSECGGVLMVYPYPHPKGSGICENCTSKSNTDFIKRMSEAIFAENKKVRLGLGVGADKRELTQQCLAGESHRPFVVIGLPYKGERVIENEVCPS